MPNLRSLERVSRKLKENNLPHYCWSDPDHPEWGMTSIATGVLIGDERSVMANYRLYAPEVLSVGTTPSKGESASSILAGCANAGAVV